MKKKRIYLDYNATSPLLPSVISAMTDGLSIFGNPSSLHADGQAAREVIEQVRERVARLIGAPSSDHIIFCSSATEANNHVIKVVGRDGHVVVSAIEHQCVLNAARAVASSGGRLTMAPVLSSGTIDCDALMTSIQPDTRLVSVMMANNETGAIQPVDWIVKALRDSNCLIHTDAVQWVGKRPINVSELGCDFLTFSAHKLGGPKGVGVLFCKDPLQMNPLLHGGSQERGLRSGTENVLSIIGLGAVVDYVQEHMDDLNQHYMALQSAFKASISDQVPIIYMSTETGMAHVINVRLPSIAGSTVMMNLDLAGVSVSTGSACSTGSVDPSHVMLAMGLDTDQANESVRISFGFQTTLDDVQFVCHEINQLYERLKA